MTEHEKYLQNCERLEESMKDVAAQMKALKKAEHKRIGNKPKNEVTLEEHEWWQDMRREGSLSTRMY